MLQNGQPDFSFPEEEIGLAKKRIGRMSQHKETISNNIQVYNKSIKKLLVVSFRDLFRGMKGTSCQQVTNRIFWIARFLATKYPKTTIRLELFENDSILVNVIKNTGLYYNYLDRKLPDHYIIRDERIIFNDVISGKKPELTEEAKKLLTTELKNNNPLLKTLKTAFEDIDSVSIKVSCYDIL